MVVEAWRAGRADGESEKAAMVAIAADLGAIFTTTCRPERRGLYLVSSNAGFASSLTFWEGAVREGVAFASPGPFPWTLSNAPCGWLAREFELRGPNLTHTGRADALGASLHQCRQDLEDQQAEAAWIVAVDFGRASPHPTSYAAMRISLAAGPVVLERSRATGPATQARASIALARWLAGAARDGCGTFSDGRTTWTARAEVTSRSVRLVPPTRSNRPSTPSRR